MDMGPYIARRLGWMVVILLVLTAALFGLEHYSPGNPVKALLGNGASPQIVKATEHRLGYNEPVVVQYWHYLVGLLHGNLQESLHSKRPVTTDLRSYLPPTLELMFTALVLAVLGGLLLGFSAARKTVASPVIRFVMLCGASMPSFLLAIFGILLFYHQLGWLPASGQTSAATPPTGPTGFLVFDATFHGDFATTGDALWHLILPSVCLAIAPAVAIGRILRSSLTSNLDSDYIRTARAKGLSERRVLFGHALRNCLNATLAMTGLQVGFMFASVAVIEVVFSWPGIGVYLQQSIQSDDFPAVMGVALVGAVLYLVVNLIVDVLQVVADRRLSFT
jgi:peptide/nickel transport system permease protein